MHDAWLLCYVQEQQCACDGMYIRGADPSGGAGSSFATTMVAADRATLDWNHVN